MESASASQQETTTGLQSARRHRAALAGALHFWVGESEEAYVDGVSASKKHGLVPSGRHLLSSSWLAAGEGEGAELVLEGRLQPWRLSLEKEARRLSSCESAALVLYDVDHKRFVGRRLGCGSRLCPVCARPRAARALARWRDVLQAASDDGCEHHHITLTQRSRVADGGLITSRERERGWVGTLAADGVVAPPVGGEGLLASYQRFRDNLRAVRQGRRTRERWRAGLGGYLLGTEWTGRDPGGVPRWHVHAHILATTAPGQRIDHLKMRQDWVSQLGDAKIRAQHVEKVSADRVVEVMKYPFKPAHLSSAERIEVLAAMKGLKPHQVGGFWHANSSERAIDDRWSRYLSARSEPPSYLRLHICGDGGAPEVYYGRPSEGLQRFALLEGGRWSFFEADAACYASLCGVEPGSDDPEPGSDEDELFELAA